MQRVLRFAPPRVQMLILLEHGNQCVWSEHSIDMWKLPNHFVLVPISWWLPSKKEHRARKPRRLPLPNGLSSVCKRHTLCKKIIFTMVERPFDTKTIGVLDQFEEHLNMGYLSSRQLAISQHVHQSLQFAIDVICLIIACAIDYDGDTTYMSRNIPITFIHRCSRYCTNTLLT